MPLTAAAGCISMVEHTLALTLADAAAFRTWLGAADQAAALARIYFGALPPPAAGGEEYTLDELTTYRPFALIYSDTQAGHERHHAAGGQRHYFTQSGVLEAILEQTTPSDDPQEADRLFKNSVGQIIEDVSDLAGQAGYLALSELRFWGPFRPHPDDAPGLGDAQQYYLQFHYGRQGR